MLWHSVLGLVVWFTEYESHLALPVVAVIASVQVVLTEHAARGVPALRRELRAWESSPFLLLRETMTRAHLRQQATTWSLIEGTGLNPCSRTTG